MLPIVVTNPKYYEMRKIKKSLRVKYELSYGDTKFQPPLVGKHNSISITAATPKSGLLGYVFRIYIITEVEEILL